MKFVQCCYAATLCRSGEGGGGGARQVPPCTPSTLTQIVPILASIYTVFHSVIFNSVVLCMCRIFFFFFTGAVAKHEFYFTSMETNLPPYLNRGPE